MRALRKTQSDQPDCLLDNKAQIYLSNVNDYLSNPGFSRPPEWRFSRAAIEEIRYAMGSVTYGKCAYCETRPVSGPLDLDHFRPIRGADRGNGKVERSHYCWLGLEWENIYLICPVCNFKKKNAFPIEGTSKLGAPLHELRQNEKPKLIDPGYDDIEQALGALSNGMLEGLSERGCYTIDLLALNRPELVKRRALLVHELHIAWEMSLSGSFDARIRDLLTPDAEFSGFLYLYLFSQSRLAGRFDSLHFMARPISIELIRSFGDLQWINQVGRISRVPSNFVPASDQRVPAIKRLSIRNFKGVLEADIDFPAPRETGAQWAAIVGVNGVGKTTILQALALGLSGATRASSFVRDARSVLGPGPDAGKISVEFWYEDGRNVIEFDAYSQYFSGYAAFRPVLLGYGAYRVLARKTLSKEKRDKHCRLHTLFDEHTKINGHHGWFNKLSGQRLNDAADTIQQLLLSDQAKVALIGSRIQVSVGGRVHPIGSMSSGMQNVFSLATDILDVLYEARDSALSGQAIVLIDELDAHLHPAWRLRVVERLRAAFPMTSFFYTTHDPLTLRGVNSEEIAVLSESDGGEISAAAVSENVEGLFVDQLLTSRLFGLHTTLSEELDGQFVRYYDLLAKPDDRLSVDQKLERDELEVVLSDKGEMGTTLRERMLFRVIDRQIAESEKKRGDTQWSDQTLEMILDVLSKDKNYQGLNNG